MTLLKDNNYKDINVALLSLEADIKNKVVGFDTSEIDKQLAEINSRIDKINAGGGNNSSDEIEDINSKLNSNSIKIRNIEQNIEDVNTQINGIEQKLADIFSAENKVTDFNTTTNSGIYYWITDAANRPSDYGVLLVNKYNGVSGVWINQIAYGTNNKIYFRQNINGGNWTEWKAVAFEGTLNADTVDNYHASQLWRSDGATWNPSANVVMTPSGNGSEWSFDFRDKNGATGSYWQVWDENKQTLLRVNADDGKVSAPYGFVGNLSGKADTAGTADKTVNDIDIGIPYVNESGQYVIPLGNIPQPGSGEVDSPYNWDITGFFSIIRFTGHAGVHITFEAGHGYSHGFTTYAYLDEDAFTDAGLVGMSIKTFQYNGKWWLGLWINTKWQGYVSKMTITYSRGLPATPTCILYNSVSNGVANKEIYDSIQDIPSWWWRRRNIYNPTTFTQNVTAPVIQANTRLTIPIGAPSSPQDGDIWIER